EEPAAGAGAAEAAHRLDGGLLHPRVTREPEVIVRADHDDPAALDVDLGTSVRRLDGLEVGIQPGRLGDLVVLEGAALVEDVAHGRVPSFEGPRRGLLQPRPMLVRTAVGGVKQTRGDKTSEKTIA